MSFLIAAEDMPAHYFFPTMLALLVLNYELRCGVRLIKEANN